MHTQISGWKKQKEFHQYFDNTGGGRFMAKEEKIILYSTHCPKCTILEKKLKDKGVIYDEVNDADYMVNLGFTEVPMLVVNDRIMGFNEAVKWIMSK